MKTTHKSFIAIGKAIGDYGINGSNTLDEQIIAMPTDRRIMCLLTALVDQMADLNQAIKTLPSRMAKAQMAEERALEKEKQKTARAQEKANEAMPTTVNIMTVSNEELDRAFSNGRIRRKF